MDKLSHTELIGLRVKVGEFIAVIKYSGPLRHKVVSKRIKKDAHWLGIQWDDKNRGVL